ncbi:uncharacterized protein BKA55DRAFT_263452 [Fusarium redolens]|uniref:Uncharacterized protein n=1 Tax=Fusarium redolens TaxID=48865 RepID=A0A9P9FXP2_FUSRE|nr:uncharacterized protein BKA55DRAFT_263452 [Fusarium redolens]KAH7208513.1 hypothetical protein BKA55DRAFT_263452 [Fusarium redolens]
MTYLFNKRISPSMALGEWEILKASLTFKLYHRGSWFVRQITGRQLQFINRLGSESLERAISWHPFLWSRGCTESCVQTQGESRGPLLVKTRIPKRTKTRLSYLISQLI